MNTEDAPLQVQTWYGLSGEIVVESDYWHLVKVGPLPLPHPPLVNLFIRYGLPREARLRLSYWHELGHLQTLPLALIHAAWLWRHPSKSQPRPLWRRLARLAAALIVHEAAWELAAESYVAVKGGREYQRLYREHPNPLLTIFWVGTTGLALLGTAFLSQSDTDE